MNVVEGVRVNIHAALLNGESGPLSFLGSWIVTDDPKAHGMISGMTALLRLYGIPNCDTVKKARAWLAAQGADVVFHDFRKQGVPADHLHRWIAAAGWQTVLNRQGTTWRKLDAATQAGVTDAASAAALLQREASAIKRPVVEWPDGAITVGFAPEDWAERLG